MSLSNQTLSFGEKLAPALLGLDALYRLESGDEEGLVVVDMSRGVIKPQNFTSYAEARETFTSLAQQATSLPEQDRRVYYKQVCQSSLAFMQWREGRLSFQDQLSQFLHVPAAPASDAELDALRDEMRTLLNRLGYSGNLAAQCAAWEARNRVPPDEVQGVIDRLLDEAWERTEERLHIPAPKTDGMKILTVSGTAFNARCNFLERKIELNTDPVLTRQSLKHLAVHEGYPGHYVQFIMRETGYREGIAPADGLLSVVNTASSSTFEGIADNGLRMIDWIEDDNDRFSALMGRYRSGIGTGAAWRLYALGWTKEQVTDWLRSQSLIGGEGWIAGRMRFIEAPARAVLIWSYWWGETVVGNAFQQVPIEKRPEFYEFMYRRMHSNQSISMFAH